MGPPDVVVLSPHLDDAVLSLGATIARLSAEGRRVEVWTAFTAMPEGPPPRRWAAFGNYTTRRAEDRTALTLLGATPRHLGLPERIWRQPRPRTLAGAFRGPADASGFACLPALRDMISAALAAAQASPQARVYAPLGIGQHADHLEVAVAVLQAGLGVPPGGDAGNPAGDTGSPAGALSRIVFYEDYYALGESFRRQHPVARRHPFGASASPALAAPALAAGLGLMAVAFRGRRLDRYIPGVRGLAWHCEPAPATAFEDLKIEAVAAYASQVPRLGGRRALEAALRRAHAVRGGELLWRVQCAGA